MFTVGPLFIFNSCMIILHHNGAISYIFDLSKVLIDFTTIDYTDAGIVLIFVSI